MVKKYKYFVTVFKKLAAVSKLRDVARMNPELTR